MSVCDEREQRDLLVSCEQLRIEPVHFRPVGRPSPAAKSPRNIPHLSLLQKRIFGASSLDSIFSRRVELLKLEAPPPKRCSCTKGKIFFGSCFKVVELTQLSMCTAATVSPEQDVRSEA